MKYLSFVILLVVCIGCDNNNFIPDDNDLIMAAKAEKYLREKNKKRWEFISDDVDKRVDEEMRRRKLGLPPTFSGTLEIQDAPNHKPHPVSEYPVIRIYGKDHDNPKDFLEFPLVGKNESFVYDLLCSNNPYAKELVTKYNITSTTITCSDKHP